MSTDYDLIALMAAEIYANMSYVRTRDVAELARLQRMVVAIQDARDILQMVREGTPV